MNLLDKPKRQKVLTTGELWQGIHKTNDVKPSKSDKEHIMRVLNREGTPFNSGYSAFAPTFAPVKDKFVERYIPLL